jgi:hypothetical protein
MKEQTVAAFLDISGDYDNVIIGILCEVMVERELPIRIIHLLWNLQICPRGRSDFVGYFELAYGNAVKKDCM